MARHYDASRKESEPASDGWHWRGGALMTQKLTSFGGFESSVEEQQKPDEDSWNRVHILSQSIKDHELLDPLLPSPDLLYHLYHEDGVRIFEPHPLQAACSCSQEAVTRMLNGFTRFEQREMIRNDGKIHITCEFCNRAYKITPPL